MIDEKRLYQMISLARFENKNRDKALRISRTYQNDYIAMSLLGNFVLTTVAYILALVLFAMYNMNFLLANLNDLNFRPMLAVVIIVYLIVLGVFSVISYTRAKLRYVRAQARMAEYQRQLRRLYKMYKDEEQLDTIRKNWGRKNRDE
ncbi:hypothetical protein [Bilifractor porci]|uniref:Uncharacterized protein n=1 Tax=Bilifractor porci TaxID=2606636 RepID=A0A7X2TPP7_9FIRM|nr:hypothetical protein [Bilifractor porci]MST82238.1 hypothetical protein [Bilifractor porci]